MRTRRPVAAGEHPAGPNQTGARASATTRAVTKATRRRRLPWQLAVVPAIFLGMTVFAAVALHAAWVVHTSLGQQGTFTAEQMNCRMYTCRMAGTFTPRDGGAAIHGLELAADGPDLSPGASTPAVYNGGGEVYPPGGGQQWVNDLLFTVVGLAGLIGTSVAALSGRRKPKPKQAPAPTAG